MGFSFSPEHDFLVGTPASSLLCVSDSESQGHSELTGFPYKPVLARKTFVRNLFKYGTALFLLISAVYCQHMSYMGYAACSESVGKCSSRLQREHLVDFFHPHNSWSRENGPKAFKKSLWIT